MKAITTILLPLSALWLSLGTLVSAAAKISVRAVRVNTNKGLVDERGLQRALYDPAPSEPGYKENNGKGCDDRFLEDHDGGRELRSSICRGRYNPFCCKVCRGFPPRQCFPAVNAFECQNYESACCGRKSRFLEEEEEEDTTAEVEHQGLQIRELETDFHEECLELEGQTAERISNARLLMPDWEPVHAASMTCIEFDLDEMCSMNFKQYQQEADENYKDWDKETLEAEEKKYNEMLDTCEFLAEAEKLTKEAEKAAEKADKEAEKAAEEAAKEAEKAAKEAEKAREKAEKEAAKNP